MSLGSAGRGPAAVRALPELLDALLFLSRSLTGTHQRGVLSDAIDLLLPATGCKCGAAYVLHDGELRLTAQRGLPDALRASLERLPLNREPPLWLLVQRAAESRTLLAGTKLLLAGEGPGEADGLRAAGWEQIVACPIAAGREVLGVMVIGGTPHSLGAPVQAIIEIACNIIAPQIAYLRDTTLSGSPDSDDGHAPRARPHRIVASALEVDAPLEPAPDTEREELTATRGVEARPSSRRPRTESQRFAADVRTRTPVNHGFPAGSVRIRGVSPAAGGSPAARRSRAITMPVPVERSMSLHPNDAPILHAPGAKVGAIRPPSDEPIVAYGLHTTVLIVDDDDAIREVLSEILSEEGYLVETAADGSEALDCIRRRGAPGLVLLDLMMPGMDGWHFLAKVNDDATLAEIPVVVMSAVAGAFKGAAAEVVTKPMDYRCLVATVERCAKIPRLAEAALEGVPLGSGVVPMP